MSSKQSKQPAPGRFSAVAAAVAAACWAGPVVAQQTSTPAAAAADAQTITVSGIRQKAKATKQDAELRDLPQAVSIVGEEQIQERAFTRIEDLGYATINVQPISPYLGGLSLGFFMRGFRGSAVLVDGYNAGVTGGATENIFDIASIERFEILRGPASVLYGQGNPGGVVNIGLKRPIFGDAGFSAELQLDRWGQRRGVLDGNVPLGKDIALRVTGSVEDSETFRDLSKKKSVYIAPALRWKITPDTSLDAFFSSGRYKFRVDRGFGFDPETIRNMAVRTNLTEPWLPLAEIQSDSLRVEAEHRLSKEWSITGGYFENRQRRPQQPEIGLLSPQPGTTLVDRYYIDYPGSEGNRTGDRTLTVRARGDFKLGGMRHQLLVGAETVKAFYRYDSTFGEVGPIDYVNPVYSNGPIAPATGFNYRGENRSSHEAVFFNDLVSLSDQWKLQVGLRHDRLNTGSDFEDSSGSFPSQQRERRTTPTAGVVYQPTSETALYASYAESFLPQLFSDRFGNPLRPEVGKSFEVGVKQDLFNRRGFFTASLFQIKKTDIATLDPDDPTLNFLKNGGAARSRGLELELSGRPVREWEFRSGLAFTKAEWTASTDYPIGATLPGAPKVSATLGVTYRPTSGALAGTWFAADASHAGKREFTPSTDPYKLPAYTRIDIGAGWRGENWDVQFNIKNLTDERILLANGFALVAPDAPRTVSVAVRYQFGSL
jgi:iron complex outermembrane receptor protein